MLFGLRQIAVQAAMIAMIMRALLPAGWMPNPAGLANGTPWVICTGQGPMMMGPMTMGPMKIAAASDAAMDMSGHSHKMPDKGQSHDQNVCPFAAAAHLALAPAAQATALPDIALRPMDDVAPAQAGRPVADRTHPPRAPPPLA